MIKNSKDKSKQGNQFKTYSYFVGGVFHASETNFFFCLPPVFLSSMLAGHFSSFAALHLTLSRSAKTLLILCCLYLLLMVAPTTSSSQACTHLNCSSTFEELLLSGRAILANVPYTLNPPSFALPILHQFLSFTPEEFMCRAEARPSDVSNVRKKNEGILTKTRHTVWLSCASHLSEIVHIVW